MYWFFINFFQDSSAKAKVIGLLYKLKITLYIASSSKGRTSDFGSENGDSTSSEAAKGTLDLLFQNTPRKGYEMVF